MSSIVSGRCNCSRHVLSSTRSSAPSDCRSAKKYEIGTARILAIAARREALTRLAPCSYFCTCWKLRSSASASACWFMPNSRRRVRIRPPTSTLIGFGAPVPRPYSGLGVDCSVRFPGFFDVAPLIRCPPAFSVTAGRKTVEIGAGTVLVSGTPTHSWDKTRRRSRRDLNPWSVASQSDRRRIIGLDADARVTGKHFAGHGRARRFVADSPLEEGGFEPSVPRDTTKFSMAAHVTYAWFPARGESARTRTDTTRMPDASRLR